MHVYSPQERTTELVSSLLAIWESSVRATHHFLSEEDIQALKPLVEVGLKEIPMLCVVGISDAVPDGFLGVEGHKIEMLFVRSGARKSGLGRKLVEYAVRELKADSVDVNEQNTQGLGFYLHMGFEVRGRSPLDGQGNPFPLLHMALG